MCLETLRRVVLLFGVTLLVLGKEASGEIDVCAIGNMATSKVMVGDKAPDFSLVDSAWKTVSLSDYKGETLILTFFPAAFSGGPEEGCEYHLCSLKPIYESGGVSVVAVSVDLPFALAAFAKKIDVSYPMASDPNMSMAEKYVDSYDIGSFLNEVGVAPELFKGTKAFPRALFVIDGEGIIKFAWVGENPGKQPPFAEIKQLL